MNEKVHAKFSKQYLNENVSFRTVGGRLKHHEKRIVQLLNSGRFRLSMALQEVLVDVDHF